MPARLGEWNAIVVGAWNTAILTPAAIQRQLFGLGDATPIEVLVAISEPAPPRVRHGGLMVAPAADKLIVTPQLSTDDGLRAAAALVDRAVDWLQQTPLRAAGINMRYEFDPLPDALRAMLHAPIDETFTDANRKPTASMTRRTLPLPPGHLNLDITEDDRASGVIELNFHLESKDVAAIRGWLGNIDAFVEQRNAVLVDTLGLQIVEATQ